MTFDEWWEMPCGANDIVSASGNVNIKTIAKGAWDAALKFAQQPHGAANAEQICPSCCGLGHTPSSIDIHQSECPQCGGSGKLPHAADVGMRVFEQTKGGRNG